MACVTSCPRVKILSYSYPLPTHILSIHTHAKPWLLLPYVLQLLPADPAGKAAARLIIQRFNDKAVPACFGLLAHQDPAMQAAAAASLDVELQWLVDVLHPVGPFALG